jgi:hypothetical protein
MFLSGIHNVPPAEKSAGGFLFVYLRNILFCLLIDINIKNTYLY